MFCQCNISHFVFCRDRVTEVHYVVSYEGQVVERYVVGNVIRTPSASQSLADGLKENDLKQYDTYKNSDTKKVVSLCIMWTVGTGAFDTIPKRHSLFYKVATMFCWQPTLPTT